MRMVKFHHRVPVVPPPPSPEVQLAALMGTTSYILNADELGADASTVSSWGPFSGVGSPVVDADGYLGSLKSLAFNGTSHYLSHPTVNLVTPEDDYVIVLAFQLGASASVRALWSFASGSSVQHNAEIAADDTWSFRNGNSFLYTAAGTFPESVPVILIYTRSETAGELRGKIYTNSGSDYHAVALASAGMGSGCSHEIGKRAYQAAGYTNMRLRFAALSVNQGALDEAGMDALASFLQTGPYNCPLS